MHPNHSLLGLEATLVRLKVPGPSQKAVAENQLGLDHNGYPIYIKADKLW